jgi:SRSO17 transposase
MVEIACLRIIEKRDCLPGKECWLFLRKNADGEIKYSLCNGPADMPVKEMVLVSGRRWSIEQLFKEGKSYLGMSDYEVRSYTGWHRHMSLVFLIMHFLLKCRIEFGQKKTL